MIDELPLVGLLGAMAHGTTVVRGAAELRVKESDRIASVVARPDARCACAPASATTASRCTARATCRAATSRPVGDHRLAMLGAVAGLASMEGVLVRGFEAVGVSYPGFAGDLAELGAVPA